MTPDWRPTLRADLVRRPGGVPEDGPPDAEPEGPSLYDPVTDRDISLGPLSLELVALIDGQRTVAELLAAAAARLPDAPPGKLEQTLRMLMLLCLIDGPGREVIDSARAIQAGERALEIVSLPDVRFACQGSGECCQNYAFGPLRRSDIARLESLDIQRKFPHLGPGPYVEELESTRGKYLYLKTVDECCIFLQDDNRCGLHAAFGPESKPDLCRLYPFQSQATVVGISFYDHGECASFSRAAIAGDSLRDQLPWLRGLMGEESSLYHPTVTLMRGLQCDFGYVLALRAALCQLIDAGVGDEHSTLLAVARLCRLFMEGLAGCPLAAGEPEATLMRVLATPAADLYVPEPPDEAAWRALTASAALQFGAVVPRVLKSKASRRQLSSERLARQYGEVIHVVRALAAAHADGVPTPPEYADLFDRKPAPGLEAAARRSLRYQIYSPRLLMDERLMPGLERLALAHAVSQIGARLAARNASAPEVDLPHFDFGHMLAMRILRQHGPMVMLAQSEHDGDDADFTFALVRAIAALCG